MIKNIKTLFIDPAVQHTDQAKKAALFLRAPVVVTNNLKEIHDSVIMEEDPAGAGKKILYLTENKGAFIKKCPGTKCYTCCDYMILNIGTYCTMDCAYCILQIYFHPPVLQFFLNWDDMLLEMDRELKQKGPRRYGTGEFTDSLIWEPVFGELTQKLIHAFKNQDHAILELKTKSTAIENLKNVDHNQKTIVSFSLNTEKMIQTQERRTQSLSARLKAAKQCVEWGYAVGFHFDPVIIYEGAEKDYESVIEKMFAHVAPENIIWISIGTFRFIPDLKAIIQKRFTASKIIYGEFITGEDNKMRYFKPLRLKIYKHIVNTIKKYSRDLTVYFCMEDEEVWQKTMGYTADDQGGLPAILDRAAERCCGLTV